MPLFDYKAKKGPEEIITGTIEAADHAHAVRKLAARGIIPLALDEVKYKKPGYPASRYKVTSKDIVLFTAQLSDLISSGVTVYDGLEVLKEQLSNRMMKSICEDMVVRLKEGQRFSDCLAAHTLLFDSFYVSMVRSGETSGNLGDILGEITQILEQDNDLRSKIKQAMAYPFFITLCGIGTVFAILFFVIPRLSSMYDDMGKSLPFLTHCVISISSGLLNFWWLWFLFMVCFFVFLKSFWNNHERRCCIFDKFLIKIPVWGAVLKHEELCRFARSMRMMLESGVSILEALSVTKDILRSSLLKKSVDSIRNDVEKGSSLGQAISSVDTFPPAVVQMIATGEKNGILENALDRVARSYEKQISTQIKIVTTLIEPVMVLVVGGVVGVIVISMLLPIFQINVLVQ